jgi:hypothetical protein
MLSGSTVDEQVEDLRRTSPLTLRSGEWFALLNVGTTQQAVEAEPLVHHVLGFKHVPTKRQPSHCGIFGIEIDDGIVQKLIAEEVHDMKPAT